MSDIAMCLKKDCPSFGDCYRAQAVKSEHYQIYMAFDNNGESCCDDYIPVGKAWKNKHLCKNQ